PRLACRTSSTTTTPSLTVPFREPRQRSGTNLLFRLELPILRSSRDFPPGPPLASARLAASRSGGDQRWPNSFGADNMAAHASSHPSHDLRHGARPVSFDDLPCHCSSGCRLVGGRRVD